MGRLGCAVVLLLLAATAGVEGQNGESGQKESTLKGSEGDSFFTAEPDPGEVEGLLALKKSLGNPEVLENWVDGTHPCFDMWAGIECGVDRVRRISLPKRGLEGKLSPMLAKVSGLQEISMPENNISGKLPDSWASLPFLQMINLQANQLSGSIPDAWSSMKTIKHMLLDSNKLSGPLPPDWWQLSSLVGLSISENSLDGGLPEVWKNMHSISILILTNNQLSKTLPESWGSITNLRILYLGDNNMYGTLPASWGKWEGIEDISLEGNSLVGSLPAQWGRLGVLTSMKLRDNNLAGAIPEEWSIIFRNAEVDLSKNPHLCGSLPRSEKKIFQGEEKKNVNIELTSIGENCSTIEYKNTQSLLEFKASIAARSKGEVLKSWSWKEGKPCDGDWDGVTCEDDSVVSIDLGDHGLSGTISSSLSKLHMLESLDLHGNSLTGSLPPQLGRLKHLREINLSQNKIGGSLPGNWSTAESLEEINLSYNFLQDELPDSWADLEELRVLNLVHNAIAGLLPEAWAEMTSLEEIAISENILTGVLPSSWSSMPSLEFLDVSSNKLVGYIPEEWGNVTNPVPVELRGNEELCGPLPGVYSTNLDARGTSLGEPCTASVRETVPLVSMRSKISDPTQWLALWKASSPPCLPGVDNWAGIICSNGHVVGISLKGFGLHGDLPEELGRLTELVALDISENEFSGKLPESWGSLTLLREVNLSGNHLEGALPSTWSSMKSIQYLDLSKNKLTGGVPEEWVELETLAELDLSGNRGLCNGLPSGLPDTIEVRGQRSLVACTPKATPFWLIVIGAVLAGTVLISLIVCVVGSASKKKHPGGKPDTAIAMSSGVKRTKSGLDRADIDNPFEVPDEWDNRLHGRAVRGRSISGVEQYPIYN